MSSFTRSQAVRDRVPVRVDRRGGRVPCCSCAPGRRSACPRGPSNTARRTRPGAQPCPRRRTAPSSGCDASTRNKRRAACPVPMSSSIGTSERRRTSSTSSASWIARPEVGDVRVEDETPTVPCRCSRAARRRAAVSVALASAPPTAGSNAYTRPDPAAAVHVLGQRARVLSRDRRDDGGAGDPSSTPRTARPPRAKGRSRAAPRAAAPRRPRGRRARAAPPGRSRGGSARPRGAAPLLDGDLGQARDRGDMQELERVRGRLVLADQQHRAELLVA